MKAIGKIFFILMIIIIFSSCFSEWRGDRATITISFGGGDGRAAAWPPTKGVLGELIYTVTLSSGSTELEPIKRNGTETIKVEIDPGLWNVVIEAYIDDLLFASGTPKDVEVIAGRNNEVEVEMKPSDYTFFAVADKDDWKEAASSIGGGGEGKRYVIIVTKGFKMEGSTNVTFGTVNNINVIIRGNHIIELTEKGGLLSIMGNQNVTLRDVKLQGHEDNSSPLVMVEGGPFTMEGSASVTGNSNKNGNCGGVNVFGTFIMKDSASVSGNHSNNGGGVVVFSGTFTMSGSAVLSGNTASEKIDDNNNHVGGNGGGVYIDYGGKFIMSESAVISRNISDIMGGGVYLQDGTFTMSGSAEISGNTTTGTGGGVYVSNGEFTMSGSAVISGNAVIGTNTTGVGGGVAVSYGTFNMIDGEISGNTVTGSPSKGGGVFLTGNAYFNMSGGIITGNFVTGSGNDINGAGLYLEGLCTFRVGGTANIRGNKKPDSNGDNSNVYLANGRYIVLGYNEAYIGNTQWLPKGMMIYVTTQNTNGKIVDNGADEEDKFYFMGDNDMSVSHNSADNSLSINQ